MNEVVVEPARHLDEKGRCCGCKPLVYKRKGIRWCARCSRYYDINTGEQVEDWAWVKTSDGQFTRRIIILKV
jgi:hypothetical protein